MIQDKQRCFFGNQKVMIFFLFLHENICYVYSLEVPHWGTSNEYPQHMFSWRNKKNIWIPLLCVVMVMLLQIWRNSCWCVEWWWIALPSYLRLQTEKIYGLFRQTKGLLHCWGNTKNCTGWKGSWEEKNGSMYLFPLCVCVCLCMYAYVCVHACVLNRTYKLSMPSTRW